jgi:hypothetical protein
MKRLLVLGIYAAISGGAFVALPAASASALPAFFECVSVKGGKLEKGCTKEKAKGGHELKEGAGKSKPFRGTGTTLNPLAPEIKGPFMKCERVKFTGTVATPTIIKGLLITENGCESGGKGCATAGQKEGTMVWGPLEGSLRYVNAGEQRVGLDLNHEGGGDLVDYQCGATFKISGSLIGELTPVNSPTSTYTLTFARDTEGFQSIKSFEGGAEDAPVLSANGSGPFKASIASTLTWKGEKLELKG